MTRRFHSHGNRSFNHSADAVYAASIYRYLGFLAAACALAYLFSGSVTIWIWVATAIALLWWAGILGGGSNCSRRSSRGRRC